MSRAQEILEILDQAGIDKPEIFFPSEQVVTSLPAFRSKIELLAQIPGFEPTVDFFSKSVVFRSSKAQITIPLNEWNEFRDVWTRYVIQLAGLAKYLRTFINKQSETSVFIKLPPTNDIAECAQAMEAFDRGIKQVVFHPSIEAKVELKNCESGSVWLEINLGSPTAVVLIGGIAWSAAVVFKKVQEGRIIAQHVESLKIKNSSLEEIKEAQANMMSLLVEAEASNLARDAYQVGADPESIARVKNTIKEFSVLIGKGAEIHPALKAPEQVKNLFPDFRKILQIESKTKMIEAEPPQKKQEPSV